MNVAAGLVSLVLALTYSGPFHIKSMIVFFMGFLQ